MSPKEHELDKYLVRIANNLNISDTMMEKAIRSYHSVGEWLGDCDDDSSVKIMPQGSINLGTVIKPITDADEYDVDLVCLLKDGQEMTESEIKSTIGDRLKEHSLYSKMLQKEGKRCWTLQYDEFHMDILPSVPNQKKFIEPSMTQIRLSHKENDGRYTPRYSNPYQYHLWFENRMATILRKGIMEFAAREKVEITQVPTYKMKTPLQQSIQLLKRHRDITFKGNDEIAPISVIITTLAAQAYNNEPSVYDALMSILNNMSSFVSMKSGSYWIENPVMKEENFAEKWNTEPAKKDAFFRWLTQAKQEILVTPQTVYGIDKLSESLQHSFGENMVKKSFSDIADETRLARERNTLYVAGLGGGLTTTASSDTKKVGGHTFFGEKEHL